MKSIASICVLLYISGVSQAQFGGGYFGGSNPFFGGWGFSMLDPLTAALFFGFDYNELMALQALAGQTRSMRPGAQNQFTRDIEALSALGLIDGPDGPDARGRAGGKQQGGGGGGGGGRGGGGPRAGGRARGGGESEGGGPAGGRRNQGPRSRRNRNRRQ